MYTRKEGHSGLKEANLLHGIFLQFFTKVSFSPDSFKLQKRIWPFRKSQNLLVSATLIFWIYCKNYRRYTPICFGPQNPAMLQNSQFQPTVPPGCKPEGSKFFCDTWVPIAITYIMNFGIQATIMVFRTSSVWNLYSNAYRLYNKALIELGGP